MKKFLAILVLVFVSLQTSAFSWVYTENTTIKQIIQWEIKNDTAKAVIKLENGTQCYIPLKETELYSLALSLYMSKRKISIHCHQTEENIGGYPSHKVHRIVAM